MGWGGMEIIHNYVLCVSVHINDNEYFYVNENESSNLYLNLII